MTTLPERTGGQLIVDCLQAQGVEHVFCVPGESYLAVLDALHDVSINVTVCRQEGGAVMMADASARLTGRPGIAMVTRGPGATNASPGIHIAEHDSVPLILFVGQIESGMKDCSSTVITLTLYKIDGRYLAPIVLQRLLCS